MTWSEKVVAISIHSEAASKNDIIRLASELMESNHKKESAIEALNRVSKLHRLGGLIVECPDTAISIRAVMQNVNEVLADSKAEGK